MHPIDNLYQALKIGVRKFLKNQSFCHSVFDAESTNKKTKWIPAFAGMTEMLKELLNNIIYRTIITPAKQV